MRILFILDKKRKAGSYATTIMSAMLQWFKMQEYPVMEAGTLTEAKNVHGTSERGVIIVRSFRSKISLITRLHLSSVIRKQHISWLVQATDNKVIPTSTSQLNIPDNIDFFLENNAGKHAGFIAVRSVADRLALNDSGIFTPEQIITLGIAADAVYQPISWSEQQSLKMQHTQGREYFFALISDKTETQLLSLLKAFTRFKKWQHSSMKLVLWGNPAFTNEKDWTEKISTYRYRDDVVFLDAATGSEEAPVMAGAYAFIHLPAYDNDVLPVLCAMQCHVPFISFNTKAIKEYAANATTLVEKDNYEEIGAKMILLYKDENLRNRLIEQGAKEADLLKEKAAEQLHHFITEIAGWHNH